MDQSKVAAVVERVRALIADGTLRGDDPLPSTRTLAAELGVARGTVVAAYEQLDGEGYIRTRHGAVARVVAGLGGSASAAASADAAASAASREGSRLAVAHREQAAHHDPSREPPRHPIDATPGIPAVSRIGERDWRAAWRVAAEHPLRDAASDPFGLAELREQIAAQLALSRGFGPGAERILVGAGTSDALSLLAEALGRLLGRPPRIAVEDPGYTGGRDALASAGAHLVPVPVGVDGLDLDALRAAGEVDAVMVTPTHQYPLGSVMPIARRRELLAWAGATDALVIEDDYDSEFRHRGTPVPALAAIDDAGVVVHLGGFSKILDPRLRVAYLVVPGATEVATAVRAAREARGPVVAEPVQAAVAHLLRTGALRRHLGRVRRDYAHKRERILARLAAASAHRLDAHALGGGLHVVLTWPPEVVPAAEVVARLADRGIRIADLAFYAVDEASAARRNGIVLGYGALTPADLDRVLGAVIAELDAP